jgi:hypothetical protein
MSLVDNPSAFPCFEPFETYDEDRGRHVEHQLPTGGMSLRDYFAAKALQSYMQWELGQPIDSGSDTRQKAAAKYARVAYEIADAMLKARTAE